jgi:solute:Na+ symporter, SSS family
MTFITLLNDLIPMGIRGLVLAALISALIGSSLSVMNSVATLVVRDFLLHVNTKFSERKQVWMGRVAIVVATPLAICGAYLIYTTPDGLYRYLQAISLYLVMPITPAIFFGILSKRVTFQGAVASVIAGSAIAALFVSDQILGPAGAHLFPWLHWKLTFNYTYRGLWGTFATITVLFAASLLTPPPDPVKMQNLTVDWKASAEPFAGISDWRLHCGILALATIAIYAWLW